jgi:hypothetical protein
MKDAAMMKGIFGDEFAVEIFGKDAPQVVAAEIPTQVGHVPTGRPVGSSPREKRKSDIQALVEQSFAQSRSNQEACDAITAAVTAYLENMIS